MSKKTKVAIFPYNASYIPVVKHKDLLKNIEITHLVSPIGFGLVGKDGYIYQDGSGYTIVDEFSNEVLENIDSIWLVETVCDFGDEDLTTLIENIAKYKKSIILSREDDRIRFLCDKNKVELITNKNEMVKNEEFRNSVKLKKIATPIITILGACENVQKFDIQLYLRNKFLENGYKVSQVGTKSYCEMFGFNSLPAYFYDDIITKRNNILNFNNFLYELDKKEKPDVIIVGVPEGIFPLSFKHTFNFGTKAYEMCNAFYSDYSILAVFDNEYNDSFYEEMKAVCKYKLNIELDSFFVSNNGIVTNSLDTDVLSYTYVLNRENTSEVNTIFNAITLNSDEIFEDVIDKLELYGTFKSI